METAMEKTTEAKKESQEEARSSLNMAETILRVTSMGLCIAALVVMLKNTDSSPDYGSVSYDNISGFRYLAYANGICAGYSLISAFYTARTRHSTAAPKAWTLFLCDQVLTYVLLAAASAAAEILYLTHKGNDRAAWSKVCGMFGSFCKLGTASMGVTFAAGACYVGLSLMSSHRLFSTYDAPISSFLSKGVEISAVPFNG